MFFFRSIVKYKKRNDEEMQNEQQNFQTSLTQFNADLQKQIQTALEEQRVEFQKELQAIDYRNDYYKKIIDKRINAYEKLYNIISNGAIFDIVNDGLFCGFFVNVDKFHEYHTKLIELHKDLFWFSEKAKNSFVKYVELVGCANEYRLGNKTYLIQFLKFDELNSDEKISFSDIEPKIDEVKEYLNKSIYSATTDIKEIYNPNTIGIGIILYPLFLDIHGRLLKIIEEDFQHLDEVEKFLKKEL